MASFKIVKRSAGDMLRCESNALTMGAGHGYEVYMPVQRLLPGQPLALVPGEDFNRPFIKTVDDQETSGVTGKNFLWSEAGCRGFSDNDPCHRKDNDADLATRRAGLFPAKCKIMMLANVNKGPWLGGAFLEKKAEALALYLDQVPMDPMEVASMAEQVAFDRNLSTDDAIDMDRVQLVASQWLDSSSFSTKSQSMDMKRFFSFVYAWPGLNTEWTGTSAVSNWLDIQLGTWSLEPEVLKELEEKVLAAQAALVAKDGGQDQPAEQELEKIAMSKEATLSDLRKKTKHTLTLANAILKDRSVQVQGRILYEFLSIGHNAMKYDLDMHKNQSLTVQWYAQRAMEGGNDFCMSLARVLDKMKFLDSVTIQHRVRILNSPELWEAELAIGQMVISMCIEYMHVSAWTNAEHAMVMPFSLAGTLHFPLGQSAAFLEIRRQDWMAMLHLEKFVYAHHDNGHGQAVAGKDRHPNLFRLMEDLDVHKHQLVRELCHLLDLGHPESGPWSPFPRIEVQLWHAFATPANTKTWLEDVFRDVRQLLRGQGHTAERYLRMLNVLVSGMRRKEEHGFGLVKVQPAQINMAKGMKRIMTTACFTPPSNPEKLEMAMEGNRPFDVGFPIGEAKPLIDLSLLQSEKEPKELGQGHGQQDVAKTNQPRLGWKPAGLSARNKTIAAMALVRNLRDSTPQVAESSAREAWWAGLLGQGLFFTYKMPDYAYDILFMSLGFFGHATLCWRLCPEFIKVDDQEYIQLSRVPTFESYNSKDKDRLLGQGPLWWFFGHEVKCLDRIKGVQASLMVPGMCPDSVLLQDCGLVWAVHKLDDFLPFVIRNRVSISTNQLSILAKVLGIPVGGRVTHKTSGQDLGAAICKKIVEILLPDITGDAALALVRSIVEPRLADQGLPEVYDPTLVGVLDILKQEDMATRKGAELDKYRQAAIGQEAQEKATPKDPDGRAGRTIAMADRKTNPEYRAPASAAKHSTFQFSN